MESLHKNDEQHATCWHESHAAVAANRIVARLQRLGRACADDAAHEGRRVEGDATLAASWGVALVRQVAGSDQDCNALAGCGNARGWQLDAGRAVAVLPAVG